MHVKIVGWHPNDAYAKSYDLIGKIVVTERLWKENKFAKGYFSGWFTKPNGRKGFAYGMKVEFLPTEWFPADVAPVHPGVYEKEYGLEYSHYHYWDGKQWFYGTASVETTRKLYEDGHSLVVYIPRRWRGVK